MGRSAALGQWRLGFSARPAARASHLALAERTLNLTFAPQNGLSVAAFTTEGVFGQTPTSGATLSLAADRVAPLGLRAGWLGERKTLLGSAAQGAFGSLAAGTAFVGIEADAVLRRLATRRQRGERDRQPVGSRGSHRRHLVPGAPARSRSMRVDRLPMPA